MKFLIFFYCFCYKIAMATNVTLKMHKEDGLGVWD